MDLATRNQETEAIVTSSRPVLEARVGPAMRNHNMEWSSSVLVFVLGIICLLGLFTESGGNNFVRFFTVFSSWLTFGRSSKDWHHFRRRAL